MLDWLKNINKDYPEFWKAYLSKFEQKSNRFVVLSTETSGLSLSKDVILSMGAFSIINDSIIIADSFETVIAQYKFFHDNGISNEFTVETKMKKMVKIFFQKMPKYFYLSKRASYFFLNHCRKLFNHNNKR